MNVIISERESNIDGERWAAGATLNEEDEIKCFTCLRWIKVKDLKVLRIGIEPRNGTLLYCDGSYPDSDGLHTVSLLMSGPNSG